MLTQTFLAFEGGWFLPGTSFGLVHVASNSLNDCHKKRHKEKIAGQRDAPIEDGPDVSLVQAMQLFREGIPPRHLRWRFVWHLVIPDQDPSLRPPVQSQQLTFDEKSTS